MREWCLGLHKMLDYSVASCKYASGQLSVCSEGISQYKKFYHFQFTKMIELFYSLIIIIKSAGLPKFCILHSAFCIIGYTLTTSIATFSPLISQSFALAVSPTAIESARTIVAIASLFLSAISAIF